MSTVLWANQLKDGAVSSQEADLYALYKHLTSLDTLADRLGVGNLSSLCDETDLLVNLDQLDLPDGMTDTNELMAAQGRWVDASEAVQRLERLLTHVEKDRPRFGLVGNQVDVVIEELSEALNFARHAADAGAQFNFAIVM